MKNFIAKQEEGAAARAGGNRKRRAARCANAVLAAGAMLVAATGLAWGQEDPRWHDPTRAWSFDFVSSGWGHAEGLPADGPALLTMPMRPAQTDAEVRMCIVEQAFAPLPQGEGRPEIRARVEQVDAAQATAAFPRMQLTQVNVTHAVIDGQAVAIVEAMSRGARFRGRVLMTRFRDRITLSTISCISAPGMQPAVEAEVDAILATLRFAE